MNKYVIVIRVIKNPKDWLKFSRLRPLSEEESEEVGYIANEYWYSDDKEKLFFKGKDDFAQVLISEVLSANVVDIHPHKVNS